VPVGRRLCRASVRFNDLRLATDKSLERNLHATDCPLGDDVLSSNSIR
jgi:hypothetical protein